MADHLSKKLHPSQVSIDTAGQVFKHAILTLRHNQTIAMVHETPDQWRVIQGNLNTRLSRGDEVSIISADGLQIADRCRVLWAKGGEIQLGKPLRLVELRETALYANEHYEVVPVGTGFSVKAKRTGRVEEGVHQTEEAAKQELLKRSPVAA